MPLRPEVVRAKLLQISEALGRLRSWLPVTAERLERDIMFRWAVEHGLHLAAEALFDTGNHILAGEFQEAADEYREIPLRLVTRGVLSAATAQRLESLAGFRNLLVHEYANIDVGRLAAGLGRLDDFEAFVADVEGWLTRSGR
ncbi:MAG: hypothetical protein A3I00_07920 [Betaproteobacteria bacterium RIFCSPLOWO2_02_FULL_64_12]|nr:MAG: hypothetical protein A3I00_07920 [Betaproteobacteria bacterium RIFCSPLOWO2_02_FULL_64_12]